MRNANIYLKLTWKFTGAMGCPKSVILFHIVLYHCIILYGSTQNIGDYYHLNLSYVFSYIFIYLKMHEMLY